MERQAREPEPVCMVQVYPAPASTNVGPTVAAPMFRVPALVNVPAPANVVVTVHVPALVYVPDTLMAEKVVVPEIVFAVPVNVTVLELAVKVPELDQLPATLRLVVPESSNVPDVIVTSPLIVELLPDKSKFDVALFWMTPVTFVPMTAEIVVVPEPAPILVTVPALLIVAVENVMVPEVALLLMVKLLVPVTPPENITDMAVPLLPMVRVPTVAFVARTIGFE